MKQKVQQEQEPEVQILTAFGCDLVLGGKWTGGNSFGR